MPQPAPLVHRGHRLVRYRAPVAASGHAPEVVPGRVAAAQGDHAGVLAGSVSQEAELVSIGVCGGRPFRCIDGRDDGVHLSGGGIVPPEVVPRTIAQPQEERERHEPVPEAAVLPRRYTDDLGTGPGQCRLQIRAVDVRRSAYDGHSAAGLGRLDYRLRARLRGIPNIVHGGEVEGRGVLRTVLPSGDPVVEPDHQVPPAHGEDAVQGRGDQRYDAPAPGHVVGRYAEVDIYIMHGADGAPVPGGLNDGNRLHELRIALVYRAVGVGIVHVDVPVRPVRTGFYVLPDRRRIVRTDVIIQIGVAEDRQIGGVSRRAESAVAVGLRDGDRRCHGDQRDDGYRSRGPRCDVQGITDIGCVDGI